MLRVAPIVVAKYDRGSVVKAGRGNLGRVPQDALLRAGEPDITYPGRHDGGETTLDSPPRAATARERSVVRSCIAEVISSDQQVEKEMERQGELGWDGPRELKLKEHSASPLLWGGRPTRRSRLRVSHVCGKREAKPGR